MRITVILALAILPSLARADGAGALSGDFCYVRAPGADRRGDGPHLLLAPAPADVPAAEGSVPVTLSACPASGLGAFGQG